MFHPGLQFFDYRLASQTRFLKRIPKKNFGLRTWIIQPTLLLVLFSPFSSSVFPFLFFSSGLCNKGLTCPYQHDALKTAICPRFVTGDCPKDAFSCPLSHDPTPQRMPLCVHFLNAGRCKFAANACIYPHVNVGTKEGVCRDFAVLGYCEKGLDCEFNHVRECPDFAERGVCPTRGCKLPHVIRASKGKEEDRKRAVAAATAVAMEKAEVVITPSVETDSGSIARGDEFVSLMFEESDDEEEVDEDGDGEIEDDDEQEAEDDEDEDDDEDDVDMEVHA